MPVAIRVTPWPDPVLDVIGHDPRSWYAETFWLPTLGPTALLLLRHLADRFEVDPAGIELPVADTAAALGLGPRDGQHSPLMRSLVRLQQFDLACRENEVSIAVRRTLPPVHRRHVRRLPAALQARHDEWTADQAAKPLDLARRPVTSAKSLAFGPDGLLPERQCLRLSWLPFARMVRRRRARDEAPPPGSSRHAKVPTRGGRNGEPRTRICPRARPRRPYSCC